MPGVHETGGKRVIIGWQDCHSGGRFPFPWTGRALTALLQSSMLRARFQSPTGRAPRIVEALQGSFDAWHGQGPPSKCSGHRLAQLIYVKTRGLL